MGAILITQCLQNDFVKPLAPGEPLPNQLHIGHDESQRLLGSSGGESLSEGPVGRFMDWAEQQQAQGLHAIHIRDWHNPDCPDQASHLAQFNPHCIQNTPGAEFIFSSSITNSTIINSTTLNDFEGTELKQILDQLTTSDKNQRLGLIGVWTEAKILFLAYELSTRYPNLEIAVCSALTASSSRSQHFLALQQLERIVGVTVIDSIGEFTQFLGGEETPTQRRNLNQSLSLEWDDDDTFDEGKLEEESEQLIRYLFRDCQKIRLRVLDGGFSGNLVAGVTGTDIHGHTQTPHVIKIGPRHLMAKERTAFEQIENVLGNNAPAIAEYADAETRGAIKYRYASMDGGKTRSLQSCFQNGEPLDKLHTYLDTVFDQQLARLYRAAVNETHNLLDYYCFDAQWADSVKQKMTDLLGNCPDSGPITLPGDIQVPNLYQFYKEGLDKLPAMVSDYPFAFIHGDLNGANVIIDERDNVWLIDFFHTHRGHVLKDFAKLENDLLYIYTPIESHDELQQAFRFTDFLLAQANPLVLPETLPDEFSGTAFERTYESMKHIRTKAKEVLDSCGSEVGLQWAIAQLRYAVHTIGFDEPNERQRVWAVYVASRLAGRL